MILWRLVVQLVAWFAISSTYYGISLMVADLPGSVYVNNAVMASVEVISYAAASLLIDRLGRRWTIAGSYVLGKVSTICQAKAKLSSGKRHCTQESRCFARADPCALVIRIEWPGLH